VGAVNTLQAWRLKYVPWLFAVTLVAILIGQGADLVRPGSLAFRGLQAAPLLVLAAWLALHAATAGLAHSDGQGGAASRLSTRAWAFALLVLSLVLCYFGVRILGGA
jgi:hypothetical protein